MVESERYFLKNGYCAQFITVYILSERVILQLRFSFAYT